MLLLVLGINFTFLKSLIFLFYTQVNAVRYRRDYSIFLYATVPVLWADILDFSFYFLQI